MKNWKFWLVLLLILSLGATAAIALARARVVGRQNAQLAADLLAVELERDGWKRSTDGLQHVAKLQSEQMRELVEKAKAKGATPILASRATTGEVGFRIPESTCPTQEPAPPPQGIRGGVQSPASTPAGAPLECPLGDPSCVFVRAKVETAVVSGPTGVPALELYAWAKLRRGAWESEWRMIPEGEIEVAHAPELKQALESWLKVDPPRLEVLLGGTVGEYGYGWAAGLAGGGKRFGWWGIVERSTLDTDLPSSIEVYPGQSVPLSGVPNSEIRATGGLRISIR